VSDLLEAFVDLLKGRKELRLEDYEIRFISAIVAGFVQSPLEVRATMAPKLSAIAREAFDMLLLRRAERSGGNGDLSN